MQKLVLPILIVGIFFFALIGYKLLPDAKPNDDVVFDETKDFSNVPKWKQWLSLIILIITLIGMIFEDAIGIKLCVAGAMGAVALILTGVITEKQALQSIDLKTIFLFGGTLSLASRFGRIRSRRDDRNESCWSFRRSSITIFIYICCIYALLCAHKFHEQYRNNSIDGSNLCIDCKRNGSRSKCRIDGMCDRWFLRICNTDWNAGKHNGNYSRRIYI